MRQENSSDKRIVDGKFQMLLLAFAAAPALVELHVQLPDHLAIASQSLVSANTVAAASMTHQYSTCPRARYSRSWDT